MFRVDTPTAAGTLPTPSAAVSPGYFTEGDPQNNVAATLIKADWLNGVQEELAAAATIRGAALDKTDNGQVAAVLAHALALSTAAATGAVSGLTTPRTRAALAASDCDIGSPAGLATHIAGDGNDAPDGLSLATLASDDSTVGATGAMDCAAVASRAAAVEGSQSATLAAYGATVTGQGSAIIASGDGTTSAHAASGDNSAVIASGNTVDTAGCFVDGDRCVVIAANKCGIGDGFNTSAIVASRESEIDQASGVNSLAAIIASNECTVRDSVALVAACFDCEIDGSNGVVAITASEACAIGSSATTMSAISASEDCELTNGLHSVLLASTNARLAGPDCVAGGWSAIPLAGSGNENLTWLIDSTSGDMYSDGTLGAGAADYAEFFEAAPGCGEIPPGTIVVLDGGKVRPGTAADRRLLGVVSVQPAVLGNAAGLQWAGRWQRDAYGRVVTAPVACVRWPELADLETVTIREPRKVRVPDLAGVTARVEAHNGLLRASYGGEWVHVTDASGQILTSEVQREIQRKRIVRKAYDGPVAHAPLAELPADAEHYELQAPVEVAGYDPSRTYVPRADRPSEWVAVGLLGQLAVRVTGAVEPGDLLAGDGRSVPDNKAPRGATIEVMRMTGDGVALCFVR